LEGLLQAYKLQAFILMSLVFQTIHYPNIPTSFFAFPAFLLVSMEADVCYTIRPIITIDRVDRQDVGTSLCLFVPDQIFLAFLVEMPVDFSSGFPVQACCLAVTFQNQ